MMPSNSYRSAELLPGALLVLSLSLLPDLITSKWKILQLHAPSYTGCSLAGQCDNVIIEEPDPVLEPLGTQVELNCSVDMAFRTAWRVILPGSPAVTTDRDREAAFAFLANQSINVTEVSSTENREPPLRINGTIGNSGTTVQCIAMELDNLFEERVCPGTVIRMIFHGKHILC